MVLVGDLQVILARFIIHSKSIGGCAFPNFCIVQELSPFPTNHLYPPLLDVVCLKVASEVIS